MRRFAFVVVALQFGGSVGAQAPAAAQPVRNLLPANATVDQFVIAADSQRTYYAPPTGGIIMYDHRSGATSSLSSDVAWGLMLSTAGDAIAYTKVGVTRREQHVWYLPLSRSTGLAAGKERRLSSTSGDMPAISPDGRWVAFARDDSTGVGQSVVVVAAAGGRERVLATSLPSGVSATRWAPDGKTLYFGVNAPVPFTCAESCLTGARDLRPQATMRRVAAAGGTAETIATVGSPVPGLSPDGRFLVYRDTGTARRFVVSDADGTRRGTFSLAATQVPHAWLGNSTLLALSGGQVQRVRVIPIPASGGESRTLYDGTNFTFAPTWSPDGRTASFIAFASTGCELRVAGNTDASARAIALGPLAANCDPVLTVDQQTVVFTGIRPNASPVLIAKNVATGQTTDLRTLSQNSSWVVDGDAALVTEFDDAPGVGRRASVWQVSLTGSATLLRQVPLAAGSTLTVIDRSRALLVRSATRDVRLVSLKADGDERALIAAGGAALFPQPTLSADRRWVAFRAAPARGDTTRHTTVELARLDDGVRKTLDVPFFVESVVVLPDAAGVIVVESRRTDQPPGVYLVDAATRLPTKLFTWTGIGQSPQIALSPDGRSLLTRVTEALPPEIFALDIATVVR
jgi:Tol biopolymer transport system component